MMYQGLWTLVFISSLVLKGQDFAELSGLRFKPLKSPSAGLGPVLDAYSLFCRAKDKYNLLIEHLEVHDFALRSCMGEVELLIITSKHLHRDSQRINNGHFLWGFFHESAAKEVALKGTSNLEDSEIVDMEIDMLGGEELARDQTSSPSHTRQSMLKGHQSRSSETHESVDMEVDMLGGKNVGKVEAFVPRPSKSNQKSPAD